MFYRQLLGSRSDCGPIDESVLDYGPCVDEITHAQLATDVLDEKIRGGRIFDPG